MVSRRMTPRFLQSILLGLALAAAAAPTAATEIRWLPEAPLHPRSLADPREPAMRISFAPDPDRIDAVVGSPIPLVAFTGRRTWLIALESALLVRLGRDGAFFPLETVDGLFGLGVETSAGPWRARLRLMHLSAHLADGDSTVSFRGSTVSREFWQLEVARIVPWGHLYVRGGSIWNAASPEAGASLALGGVADPGRGGVGPYLALHLQGDGETSWKIDQSIRVGWVTGTDGRFRAGLRYSRGNRPQGQYRYRAETFMGLEVQFQSSRIR